MFGLGPFELIIILVIVVLLFGVGRLPELGSGLGEGIKNFKKSVKDTEKELLTKEEPENKTGEEAAGPEKDSRSSDKE